MSTFLSPTSLVIFSHHIAFFVPHNTRHATPHPTLHDKSIRTSVVLNLKIYFCFSKAGQPYQGNRLQVQDPFVRRPRGNLPSEGSDMTHHRPACIYSALKMSIERRPIFNIRAAFYHSFFNSKLAFCVIACSWFAVWIFRDLFQLVFLYWALELFDCRCSFL